MENFTRECLEMDSPNPTNIAAPEDNMRKVYESASRLVKRTLDVEGALIVDVSNFEVLQSFEARTSAGDGSTSEQHIKVYHGNLFEASQHTSAICSPIGAPDESGDLNFVADRRHEYGRIPAPPLLACAMSDGQVQALERNGMLSGDGHRQLAAFLAEYPDGKIFERVVPSYFRNMIPSNIQYAMRMYLYV